MQSFNAASAPAYQAHTAYKLREFAKSKRYTMQEIHAFVVNKYDSDRNEVEGFISDVFETSYGATLHHFMPVLVALRDADGYLMAAFGLRSAATEALFLEQYLDVPIEHLMSSQLNKTITRDEITEIGNLAVANPRNAGILIAHVIQQSLDMQVKWCVATAHRSLQNGLVKGGRDVFALHSTDVSRLPKSEQALWGSYYDNQPQIIAVRGITS
ncbi:MAG: hypothetical protein BVN34_08755 [Proteobacteria bacterium ST_bin12]|nr:MAG: hypothetical protein BVN34_08755 [Proteobacteria bacterium ST_bin12]